MGQAEKLIPNKKQNPENISDQASKDLLLDFVAIMVHDLQGPFVSMQTMLKLLKRNKFDPNNKNHAELLNSAIIAFERSETIIHDLIDSARAGRTGFTAEPNFYEIDNLIINSARMLNASAAEYGIRITLDLKAGAKARLDEQLFMRVIDNLLFNAIKHNAKGAEIIANSYVEDDKVIVEISDDGIGFGDINTDDLFDKYKQLELRKEGKYKGVGIGLYFCRLAIEAMGGRIWAENNSRGGASFKISLIKDRRRG